MRSYRTAGRIAKKKYLVNSVAGAEVAEDPHLGWPCWRGPNRDGHTTWLPESWSLPEKKWSFPLPSNGVGGVSATEDFVVVSSRDRADKKDHFVCLDASSGLPLWQYEYEAIGDLDYGNSPRATSIIADPYVITLGAFGKLTCLDIDSGEEVWAKHLIRDLGGQLPIWGFSSSPLLIDQRLIVQPGGKDASIVALSLTTGEIEWKTPGRPAAYASPILVRFASHSQIVAYDAESLGGWDLETGKRLWEMMPNVEKDFNVPTPVSILNGLVLTTENNATRVYRFDERGVLSQKPEAEFLDLSGDSHTPIAVENVLFGISGNLIALDVKNGLQKLGEISEKRFGVYASMIAHRDRVLVLGDTGEAILYRHGGSSFQEMGRWSTQKGRVQLLSHPAMVERTLYVRGPDDVTAWEWPEE